METAILIELIRLVPIVLLLALVALFFFRVRDPVIQRLLSRVSGVGAFGFRIDLLPEDVQRTVEAAAKDRGPVARGVGSTLLERAQSHADLLARAQVLWVDDNQASTLNERRLLHQLGVYVEPVRSTAEAVAAIARADRWSPFDLVVSDMDRDGDSEAGESLIRAMEAAHVGTPVVIYLGNFDPSRGVPLGAYGITNRPDVLMELVMDVLERKQPSRG